jgi:hypothetical protein
MIGLPKGLNESQWRAFMAEEHEGVHPLQPSSAVWGASDRAWTTGACSRGRRSHCRGHRLVFFSKDSPCRIC